MKTNENKNIWDYTPMECQEAFLAGDNRFICLNWAFNRHRGPQIKKHWDRIQRDTDILVTHGPAYGILDTVDGRRNEHLGCEELIKAIDRIKPKFHICGHIHTGYGTKVVNGTTHVNASLLDENYQMVNKPVNILL